MILAHVIGLQVVAIVLIFISVVLIAFRRSNSLSNVILCAFVCGLVQNLGYLFELRAKDVNMALDAIRIEYVGGAFVVSLLTFFVFKYAKMDFPIWLKYVLLFEGVLTVLGVWSWEYNGMYYTSADFVTDSVLPHIVLGHGWLYFVVALFNITECLVCCFICMFKIIKTKVPHMRRNYSILFCIVAMPLVGYVVGIMGTLDGYDTTPISVALAITIFGSAIARNRVVDIADSASAEMIENLDDAVIVIDNEMCYESSNGKAKDLFPELLEIRYGTKIENSDILEIFNEDGNNEITIGERFYDVHMTSVAMDNVEIGKAAMLIDVTDNKRQLEKMRELMISSEQANIAKSEFITNVSHEIRTPINVIMGMSEVLYRDYRNPDTDNFVIDIRNAAQTLLGLINDILDFSKIESGKMDIKIEQFDMRTLLYEIYDVYKFRSEKKNLTFEMDVPENIRRYLFGDQVRIKQIFNNLLSNAVKYTETGFVKVKIETKERNEYDFDLLVSVEDSGIGIKREDQGKIFNDFARVDLRKTSTLQGTGLGLNITKQLVKLMKGALNFRSEYGKGSIFTIVIPLRVDLEKTETIGNITDRSKAAQIVRTAFTAEKANILVVDDSTTNLIVVKQLLKKTKVNITTATSGAECLELCKENDYDLIFLDHRMPEMDGVETFEKMRVDIPKTCNVPVVMLTANAIGEAKEFYLSKNFTDFLSKPVKTEQLLEMLLKYLPTDTIEPIRDIDDEIIV